MVFISSNLGDFMKFHEILDVSVLHQDSKTPNFTVSAARFETIMLAVLGIHTVWPRALRA
jgi:hypothetical protein